MRSKSVVLALLVACGNTPDDSQVDANGNGTGDDSGNSGDAGSGGNGNQDGCSDAAKLVYVVDSTNKLSTFEPASKVFTEIGTLTCPATLGSPFSMAIDRDASAWVLYTSGELFHLDTTSLACTKETWNGLQSGLLLFGMGFSTDVVGGTTDTLFISGGISQMTSATLATMSIRPFAASKLGSVGGWPELTGTGNAELWGWFPDATAPRIQKLDKTSGAGSTMFPLTQLAGKPSAWAFAFWGGDFWVFLQRMSDATTIVHQVDGTTGEIKSSTPANRRIVGAGVSTCAPIILL